MTRARKKLINLEQTPYYHCISRCVRRAYLCGSDEFSGKDYEYRKDWIVSRMKDLASSFAIDLCAYAVMSNHYHVVLHVDKERCLAWSDTEVIERWGKIYPKSLAAHYSQGMELDVAERDYISDHIAIWRERLMSISEFMRGINEYIARRANAEEECKGRFWEGRFKSQALLDEGALLTCMAYVDLNPIRAQLADTPESSDNTSIQERIVLHWQQAKKQKKKVLRFKESFPSTLGKGLMPFARATQSEEGPIRLPIQREDYFELIEATGRALHLEKKGAIAENIIPILQRLELNEKEWLANVQYFHSRFFQAIGAMKRLNKATRRFKQQWLKGVGNIRNMYQAA